MKNLIFGMLVLVFACNNQNRDVLSINQLSDEEIKGGWELLFDGKSMNEWRNFNGDSLIGWSIEDGCMVALGEGGDHANDIITKSIYKNFILSIEWKVTEKANSGIFYHALEDSVKAIYEIAPEYQVLDDPAWEGEVNATQKAGANYAMHAPDLSVKKLAPRDSFNHTQIVVKDSMVEHWLNGEKVVSYKLWSAEWDSLKNAGKWKDFPKYGMAKEGHIGLQDHGNKTYYRNIKILKQ